MWIYVVITIFSMLCASYAQNVRGVVMLRSTYKCLAVLSFLPFALVSMLRFEVGTDWSIYDDYFHWINEGTDRFSEQGFNLLNRIIYLFTKDSVGLFMVVAFLILLFTFLAIYEQSVNIPLSILIFVLTGDFFNSQNQIRQALGMAICIFAFRYVYKRKFWKYLICVLIAFSFHASALLFIPLYWLYGRKISLKVQGLWFAGLVVVLPVANRVLQFIISKTRYSWYFTSRYNQNNFYLLGFLVSVGYLIIYFFYYYYSKAHGEEEDDQYDFLVNIFYLAAVSTLFSTAIPQMVRITSLFSGVAMLSIPKVVQKEHDRNRRIVLYIIVCGVYLVKLIFDVYRNGWYDAIPYQTFLFR